MLAIIILSALLYGFWLLAVIPANYRRIIGFLAWILHGCVSFTYLIDKAGWNLTIINAVLLVSWLSVVIVLLFKIRSLWVKIPLVVFVLSAFILTNNISTVTDSHLIEYSWQLDLHISLSMLSYSVLSVAALFAISLWIHIIKIRKPNAAINPGLISLIEEERKLFQLIFLGWLILSTSLLSGVIFVQDFMQQHLGHKVVFSLLAWIIFGLLILGRLTKGWRGEKLITLTIMGMTLLATGYLGSKIVLEWFL